MMQLRRQGKQAEVASAAAAAAALTFPEQMLAGAIARGVAQTILHPIDVVRTRMQARGIARSWAPKVFVKGVAPQIVLALPAGAVQFAAFEAAKTRLKEWLPSDSMREVRTLIAGAFGATVAASCRVPQEVLKQRVQADVYANAAVALRETIRADGLRGLYSGWAATLSRDVPWNALSFMFHGLGKQAFRAVQHRAPRNDENLAIAGVAGAMAALVTMPIDVVKTRLMTQAAGTARYSGIFNTLTTIIREEGAMTLMKGVVPRICFLAPLAGVTFSVYEGVVKVIRKRKVEAQNAATVGAVASVAFSKQAYKMNRSPLRRRRFLANHADTPCYLAAYEGAHTPLFVRAS